MQDFGLIQTQSIVVNIKRNISSLFYFLGRKYWRLNSRTRHIVGWTIILICLVIVLSSGYGIYQGVKGICQLCYSAWISLTEGEEQELEFIESDEWCFSGNHYKFPVSEKNPKRHINLAKDFNDINDTHIAAAEKLGIKPLKSRDAIEQVSSKLVRLKDTKYFKVDSLTHSSPYLVPKAADFLTVLGKLLQEYNGTTSRFVITSVLRTDSDVKRLSRGNVNASQNSAHRYGTTIDITYNRFDRHGVTNDIQLKTDLARALYDMRKAGYCYVKYERKQACFHITVRP